MEGILTAKSHFKDILSLHNVVTLLNSSIKSSLRKRSRKLNIRVLFAVRTTLKSQSELLYCLRGEVLWSPFYRWWMWSQRALGLTQHQTVRDRTGTKLWSAWLQSFITVFSAFNGACRSYKGRKWGNHKNPPLFLNTKIFHLWEQTWSLSSSKLSLSAF